jgi:hypothetical protein
MLVGVACGNSKEYRMSRPWIEVMVFALLVASLRAQAYIERRDDGRPMQIVLAVSLSRRSGNRHVAANFNNCKCKMRVHRLGGGGDEQ